MASVTAKEIPETQGFFNEFWALCKKYYIPEYDDCFWESVNNEFTALRDKYQNVKSASGMINAFIFDDLEVRYKEMKKEAQQCQNAVTLPV